MTEGEVVSIDADGCRGWAVIADLPRYAATVHLVLDDRLLASAIADQEAGANDDPSVKGDCWFEIDVPPRAAKRIAECRVLVGESGHYLRDARQNGGSNLESPVSASPPASFRDALDRGLGASDVIDLLYLDILRRPVDKASLRAKLIELETGHGSFESFRHALLDSDEYRRLMLRVREAPGRTFARRIVYASSARRLAMERHVAAFQRLDAPLRGKLLDFLPGLVAMPEALSALEALAGKGVPEREIFFRALGMMSRRPSLIVADRRGSVRDQAGSVAANGDRGVTLDCSSPLFVHGWSRLERSPTVSFRWMEQVGVLLNPRPGSRLARFELGVEGWYGGLDRTITAVADGVVMSCERREGEGAGATLTFTPPDGVPVAVRRVALVAAGAACPWRFDGTPDMRLVSCQVSTARFEYDGEAA